MTYSQYQNIGGRGGEFPFRMVKGPPEFIAACQRGEVAPTHRQYRKYCREIGTAHKHR